MRLPVTEDQLSEVTVVGDEDAALTMGDGEDVGVLNGPRVLVRYRRNVMSPSREKVREAMVGALVEQESHATVAGCRGNRRRYFPTTACAYSRHARTSSRVRRGNAAKRSVTSGFSARC